MKAPSSYVVTTIKEGKYTLMGKADSKVYASYWDIDFNFLYLCVNNQKIELAYNFEKVIQQHKNKLLKNPVKYML